MQGWEGVVFTAIALSGCQAAEVFQCSADENCGEGQCEPTSYCSFPDPGCASGSRYGEFAGGGFAGECVEAQGDTEPGSGSNSATTVASSATSTDPTVEPTSETSNGSMPVTTTPVSGSEDGSGSSGEPPANGHRVLIDLDTATLDETATDFVLPIRLDDSIIDLSWAGQDGTGLRFYDEGALIPHEIETWSDDAALVWVKVPSLQAGADQIELRVGEPSPANPLPTTQVWSDYVLVYHMNDEVFIDGDPIRDASGFAFDGAATSLADQQVDGLFGPAFNFDGDPTGSATISVGGPPELEANPAKPSRSRCGSSARRAAPSQASSS